jgi:hypothetical protein
LKLLLSWSDWRPKVWIWVLEIAQLKREVARPKAERGILKKAAAYFAKEST